MQHTSNNNLDKFTEIFQQKLKNHQVPVDASSWTAIEKSMNKNKKFIPRWMMLAISSAAVLALIIVLQTSTNSVENFVETKNNKEILENEKHFTPTIKSTIKSSPQKASFVSATTTKRNIPQKSPQLVANYIQVTTSASADTLKIKSESNKALEEIVVNEVSPLKDENSAIEKQPMQREFLDLKPENPEEEITVKKRKSNWLLAASYGSQGNPQLSTSRDLFASGVADFGLNAVEAKYSSIMAPNDFSSKTYSDPVTAGITIRRMLNSTFSIETGFQYTYLLSSFENSGMQRSDGKLHLHYVGIPINIVATLWSKKKWELYSTLGATVEKALQSVYVQNVYSFNQTYTTTATTKITGFQWSLNGGFGLGYTLQKQIGIYVEPRFSHYFQNDQPVSVRTDKPFVFGLNVGLRIGI